jgi:hypothetical protein
MPHVTTKEIVEKQSDGTTAAYLRKHAVYCRYRVIIEIPLGETAKDPSS